MLRSDDVAATCGRVRRDSRANALAAGHEASPTRAANSAGSVIFSLSATCCSTSQISASDGAATRTGSVRDRTASSTREMLLHSRIRRHAPATARAQRTGRMGQRSSSAMQEPR